MANLINEHKGSIVIHVGAGLSTSAGIRDFRGKGGVWTELQLSQSSKLRNQDDTTKSSPTAELNDTKVKPFDLTVPTFSHLVLRELCDLGIVRHIISQNVDGLFLKSNLNRKFISELHGNFYLDECTKCRSRFIRSTASQTMRLQKSSIRCLRNLKKDEETNNNDLVCKGFLRDTILDWESSIPFNELRVATREAKRCKLHICIGTSLQLRPSKDLVCKTKLKAKGEQNKLVIINLQPTQFDTEANLVINHYVDEVMKLLVRLLDMKKEAFVYDPLGDPTKNKDLIGSIWRK